MNKQKISQLCGLILYSLYSVINKQVCNSFVLFKGNLAHREPNYSQKPVTDHDAFQSIFIANNAGRDNPTINVIERKPLWSLMMLYYHGQEQS